ncbi:MAG: hypothetical protein ABIN18_05590 [Pseudomonadota bacterium]
MIGGTKRNVISLIEQNTAWYHDTLTGQAFTGGTMVLGVAAQQTHIQLWNPVASGKIGILEQIHVWVQVATSLLFRTYNIALAAEGTYVEINKYIGGAAPGLMVKMISSGPAIGNTFTRIFIPANVFHTISFSKPFIIPEGQSLVVACQTLDVDLEATFEWNEVPV